MLSIVFINTVKRSWFIAYYYYYYYYKKFKSWFT